MQSLQRIDYYRLGKLAPDGCPLPAGFDGFDSNYDWTMEDGRRKGGDAAKLPPAYDLQFVDDTHQGIEPWRPIFGFKTPVCDELTIFLVKAEGIDTATNPPAALTFRLQLRTGVPFLEEPDKATTVTLPTITDGGRLMIARGLSFVSVQLWGYIPTSVANAVRLRVAFRFLIANKGACCNPDFTGGNLSKLDT